MDKPEQRKVEEEEDVLKVADQIEIHDATFTCYPMRLAESPEWSPCCSNNEQTVFFLTTVPFCFCG